MTRIDPAIADYITSDSLDPLFIAGDSIDVLQGIPTESIDCCMTSPPYWGKREYLNGGIGLESTPYQYIENLLQIFLEVKRALKSTGSLWINMGDTYHKKGLVGTPWRLALRLIDDQGWILRNDVVWNKIKGIDNSKDKLKNLHEYVFHFTKIDKDYHYDMGAIRSNPRKAQAKGGLIVSATGVTGARYKKQIETSASLTDDEKILARNALDSIIDQVARGGLPDFRMIIRGQQRATHSESVKLSGRALELHKKGFYFLKSHPEGSKPGDVWDIMTEDTQNRKTHYAAYPEALCRIPILATCPPLGIVLDPFSGTGTTNLAARKLERKSIGIDKSQIYIDQSQERCRFLL